MKSETCYQEHRAERRTKPASRRPAASSAASPASASRRRSHPWHPPPDRLVSCQPRLIILDEPTANLSAVATDRLLETMLELRKQHVAQIIISHRLTDIFKVGDRVMVLKRGQNVGERAITASTEQEVLEIIVSGTPQAAGAK